MAFNTESTVAIITAAKDLTIHSAIKKPEDVAETYKVIYAAIVEAIRASQDDPPESNNQAKP